MADERLTADKIRELFAQGYSIERIKREFGGSKDRIRKFRPTDRPFTPTVKKLPYRPWTKKEKAHILSAARCKHLSGSARAFFRQLWEESD